MAKPLKDAANAKSIKPWYKEKYARTKYLDKGEPEVIVGSKDLQTRISGWIPPTQEEIDLWEDCRMVVLNKNKKREFLVTPCELTDFRPTKKGGLYTMKIEVVHVDYQGFVYTESAATHEALEKMFWPVADKLVSHFCSPKIKDKKYLNKAIKAAAVKP